MFEARSLFRLSLLLWTLWILVACEKISPSATPIVTRTTTAHPQNSVTILFPTSSATVQPSQIASRTVMPTLTPWPTLTAEDAYQRLEDFVRQEETCVLPCWIGIVPGESNFDSAQSVLSQFSAIGKVESYLGGLFLRVNFPTYYVTTEVQPASDGRVAYIKIGAPITRIANERRVYDDPAYTSMWHRYFLPELFAKNGEPGKVFLDTTRLAADPDTVYPFVVWVVYPEHGFLVRYEGLNAKVGDVLRICPLQSDLQIISWPAETLTYEEFIKGDMAMATSIGPQPIEDVTDFDARSFYEQFRDAQFGSCFDTPASLWPH